MIKPPKKEEKERRFLVRIETIFRTTTQFKSRFFGVLLTDFSPVGMFDCRHVRF
jgi:hypothetical protein